MPERNQNSWAPFAVGPKSTNPRWIETACSPLKEIFHVTHVRHALLILDDGVIRARPVYDESRLNTTRIHVVWLSPNDWTGAGGSRYGNVVFNFEWHKLVQDMKAYWVGSMEYEVEACRILLTRQDRSNELQEYDPKRGDGPWWYETEADRHWWNGKFCLEILLERDLLVNEITDMSFTQHHKSRCCLRERPCRDADQTRWQASPELLAAWASGPLATRAIPPSAHSGALKAWSDLLLLLSNLDVPGGDNAIAKTDTLAPVLARALLSAITRRDDSEQDQIARLFRSKADLYEAVASVIAYATGVKRAELRFPDTKDVSASINSINLDDLG